MNVDVDGVPAVAWKSVVPRRAGSMQLITFDAQATFDHFELRPLAADAVLRPAADGTPRLPSVEEAEANVNVARRELEAARALPESITARTNADRLRYAETAADGSTFADVSPTDATPDQASVEAAITEAARWSRIEQALAAEIELAKLQAERATAVASAADPAPPESTTEIDAKIVTAQEKLTTARQAIDEPGTDYVSLRGAFKSIESPTETPESIAAPFPLTSTGRRTALADWIVDRRNPLTARVAVNHLWTRHFGAPLVPTMFDFGRKGLAPSHPELLDYLAVELMEQGWSLKQMHRLMVTSRTYRMSSSNSGLAAAADRDSENRSLWRMNANRMEAQVVRDSLLFLAGELDLTAGGPSIPLAEADGSKRRSLYFVHSHNDHHRLLATFDDAGVQECYRRDQSIVPQQALALANSRLAIESARAIAERIHAEANGDSALVDSKSDERFVRNAFLQLLGFEPSEPEATACRDALQQWRGLDSDDPQQAEREARAALILALINHNDFITIR